MHHHHETNPHFNPPPQHESQHSQPPGPWVSQPRREDQQTQPSPLQPRQKAPKPRYQGQQPRSRTPLETVPQHQRQPLGPWSQLPVPGAQHQGQHPSGPSSLVTASQHPGQPLSPWSQLPPYIPEEHQGQQPSGPSSLVTVPQHPGQPQSPWFKKSTQGQLSQPHSPPVPEAQHGGRRPQRGSPKNEDRSQTLIRPKPRKTNWIYWFFAAFCTIFWVIIILGGLAVLTVYLVFRPHSPRFDVPSATLNAAYLDMGYLLNADLTVLANFTNPNKRVSVDFSYVTLDLYYGNTLIATQYIEPFKAAKKESRFADVHMVTSQVQLPLQESEQLQKQIDSNRVQFNIKGVFHARSILGNFFGYSYRLYAHCTIEVSSPPSGVLRASKCKTKR